MSLLDRWGVLEFRAACRFGLPSRQSLVSSPQDRGCPPPTTRSNLSRWKHCPCLLGQTRTFQTLETPADSWSELVHWCSFGCRWNGRVGVSAKTVAARIGAPNAAAGAGAEAAGATPAGSPGARPRGESADASGHESCTGTGSAALQEATGHQVQCLAGSRACAPLLCQ